MDVEYRGRGEGERWGFKKKYTKNIFKNNIPEAPTIHFGMSLELEIKNKKTYLSTSVWALNGGQNIRKNMI